MSVPGLFHTAFALGRNLTGGRQENSINMEICARQALYYHQLGDKEKAISAAFDSIEFANSIFWSSEAKQRAEDLKPLLDSIIKSNASREDNRSYANSYSKSEPFEQKYSKSTNAEEDKISKSIETDPNRDLKNTVKFLVVITSIIFILYSITSIDNSKHIPVNKLTQDEINDLLVEQNPPVQRLNNNSTTFQPTKIDYRHTFSPNGFCVKCRFKESYLLENRIYCTDRAIVEQSNIKEPEIQKTINNETSSFRVKITNSPILTKKDWVTNTIETKTNAVKIITDSNRGFNFNKTEHRGPTLRKLKQNEK